MSKQVSITHGNSIRSAAVANLPERTVSEAEIAQRAYEIYQRRGYRDGSDLDDWLQAEHELNQLPSIIYGTAKKAA